MATVNIDIAKESSVQAVKTDTEEIKTAAGSTGDSGGTASGGSVFAKLNKIISDLATHMGRWTSTRAAKLDAIGSTADTGGSETAGTVMGKLNNIINSTNVEYKTFVNGEITGGTYNSEETAIQITGKGIIQFVGSNTNSSTMRVNIDGQGWSDSFPMYNAITLQLIFNESIAFYHTGGQNYGKYYFAQLE